MPNTPHSAPDDTVQTNSNFHMSIWSGALEFTFLKLCNIGTDIPCFQNLIIANWIFIHHKRSEKTLSASRVVIQTSGSILIWYIVLHRISNWKIRANQFVYFAGGKCVQKFQAVSKQLHTFIVNVQYTKQLDGFECCKLSNTKWMHRAWSNSQSFCTGWIYCKPYSKFFEFRRNYYGKER